jgi:hypothetical protein
MVIGWEARKRRTSAGVEAESQQLDWVTSSRRPHLGWGWRWHLPGIHLDRFDQFGSLLDPGLPEPLRIRLHGVRLDRSGLGLVDRGRTATEFMGA